MRKKFLLFAFLFTASFLIAQETPMSPAEISAFKEKVSAVALKTETIKSDFVQYKHLDFLTSDVKTSGKMLFKAPNLVRWEYTEPYQYSVVFNENQLLINDGGTKSKVDIGSSKLFRKLNELIVNSVKGDMFSNSDFDVAFFKISNFDKAVFTPKDAKIAAYIASFELLFNKADGHVVEVKMIEPSKDFTRIVFRNRILNQKIDASVFTH